MPSRAYFYGRDGGDGSFRPAPGRDISRTASIAHIVRPKHPNPNWGHFPDGGERDILADKAAVQSAAAGGIAARPHTGALGCLARIIH